MEFDERVKDLLGALEKFQMRAKTDPMKFKKLKRCAPGKSFSSESGAICLDILKNEWSPALTIRTALISLQALLSVPEPDDPQDAEVAKMYKENKAEYENTAKFWTTTYATGARSSDRL